MDQVKTGAIQVIDEQVADLTAMEKALHDAREVWRGSIHPWAMPSLANAIGSIQHAIVDLKAARHHIETPEPAIDASFEIVK